MAKQPVYWIQVAEDVANAETHVRKIEAQKQKREQARATRVRKRR